MKDKIESKIIINAPVEKVWEVLMDFDNHPQWNPFIHSINGEAKVGNKINLHIGNMKLTPVVLVNSPNKEFRWKGNLFSDFIFTGEHYFKLNKISENQTEFIHGEDFLGVLLVVFKYSLKAKTLNGFREMNEALKKVAEGN